MNEIIIPINGKQTKIRLDCIEINRIELDEFNPRISFFRDNQPKENLSNEEICYALINKKPEAFKKLRDSIQNNQGIVTPIWVEPLTTEKYMVIEGNTRLVIYRNLNADEPYNQIWQKIQCYILPAAISDEQKNFIRLQSHLRGTTDWDAYEKAKYLYKLWEEEGWSINRLEKQTKMTEKQIKENIDAYQMMEELYLPKHGNDPNEVSKFSYFVEYIKDKSLQKLIERHFEGKVDFCEWVANKEKLPTGQDVRKLKNILEVEESRSVFRNSNFESAIEILELKRPNLFSNFYKSVDIVIDGLKDFNNEDYNEFRKDENREKINKIVELSKWVKITVDNLNKD